MDNLKVVDGKVILFTCQNDKSLENLKKNKKIVNKKSYIEESFGDISDIFLRGYNWFVETAETKVCRPDSAEYHIWCSTTAENCMKPIENEVVYIIKIPLENIIFFDSIKWDHVLNLRYIPKDNLDYKKYLQNLKAKGFKSEYDVFKDNKGDLNLIERDKIIKSWYRIFDIENTPRQFIQANIWEINEKDIVDIIYFGEEIPSEFY